jgi:membrane protease YdiL (CAAX protease family)
VKHAHIVLSLWLLAVAGFFLHTLDPPLPTGLLIATTLAFAVLMGLYLLFSQPGFGSRLESLARTGGEYGLPGLLWIGFAILTLIAGSPNAVWDIVLAGAVLWLPTTLVVSNRESLTPLQAIIGLSILIVPLGLDAVSGSQPDATQVALRAGAFALPILLIALTTPEQKSRLSFWFITAVTFMWFAVEFGGLPDLSLSAADGAVPYMQLATIVLFLYLLVLAGRLPDLGFTFTLTRRDWIETGAHLALFAAIAIPIGLLTGFIRPAVVAPSSLLNGLGQGLAIFYFIALPEEILFRGTIHRYLERVLRWSPAATLALSSLIFGASHLNNPPDVGWYFVFATAAGVVYGRTYLRTGKVLPAAMVHLMVDWIWSVFFAG